MPPETIARVAMMYPRNIVPESPTIQARRVSYRQKTKSVGRRIVRNEKTKTELLREASEVSVRYNFTERSQRMMRVTRLTLDVIARPLSLQLIAFITRTYQTIVTTSGIR